MCDLARLLASCPIRDHFAAIVPTLPAVFDALPADASKIFFWKLDDVRSPIWSKGRVVLLGDAATAFLPTAGVGASNAMESAAVLADELRRVETRDELLKHYLVDNFVSAIMKSLGEPM